MTVKELIEKLRLVEKRGYGDKDIVMDIGQGNSHIDSVQQDTYPITIEPDYFLLMQGEEQE